VLQKEDVPNGIYFLNVINRMRKQNKRVFYTILLVFIVSIILLLYSLYVRSYYRYENFEQEPPTYTIYVLWTGTNEMSQDRKNALENLKVVSECNVILINPSNLSNYIKPEHPLHEAYEYLSETHKADYMRTYLMHFYGGGYSDIKKTTGSWKKVYDELLNSDKWICGYAETESSGGIAYPPLVDKWRELIGNAAYICKPNTPLTNEWYNEMMSLLDMKLEQLKMHPATHPQDKAEDGRGYPIEWNEMLGRIFHRLAYKYKDHVMNTLPISIFTNYR